ncbi:Zinc finger, RING/FYVE/PHD-type [Cynara cardunculus var. scolymus]|uniref:RING-type E3 ubiquitin transferase n=1 Tax=Cynara cardunculus var. scolymus TaxID=59895 RepID=A0A103XKB8_CYNCS|nr:Zinc finger, RING/FYVE/PHD-type [Cynara cardunculus var. scolymus]
MIHKLISSVRSYFGLRAVTPTNRPQAIEPGLEGESCCVCLLRLEKATDDEKRVLACGHEFHKACVDKWFDVCRKTCPVCRFPVEVEEVKSKKREELTEEMVIWFSSFHVAGYI